MDLGLTDKIAVVTGASRGLGLASARALVAEGCRVCICARGEERLAEAALEVEAAARKPSMVTAVRADVSTMDGVARVIEKAVETFGGLDVRPVDTHLDWDGLTIHRTPARHGFGAVGDAMAPVSGFVLDDLYLAGDTVWYEGVERTIERFAPRVSVVHASGASFLEGGRIVMDADDVREVVARVPVVIAVHFEAINHCHLSRAELRAAVPSVLVPADGETIEA